jgi:hypothetical protein
MPAESALTELGQTFRSWLPVALRDSPDHLAVLHCLAHEVERLEGSIETVRAQFFPQSADLLLKVYEAELGITVEPAGATLDERRSTVIAMLRRAKSDPSGITWQDNVTRLVGTGWSYAEHDPSDPSSPPEYTVRVTLPFAPSSGRYAQTERLLRDIIPAHLDLVLTFAGGFVLDESQLDQEALQ